MSAGGSLVSEILALAMSDENMEAVRRFYGALAVSDIDRAVELCDPEIEVEDPDLPGAGRFHGREGLRSYLTQAFEPWEYMSIELEGLRAAGDRAEALKAAGLA